MSSTSPYEGLTCFDPPEKYLIPLHESVISSSLASLNPSQSSLGREFGRWNIEECQIYLEVLKECEGKDVIKELKKAIPSRIESQIRAHHVKMMRKFGTVQKIIQVSDSKNYRKLLELHSRLQKCEQKTSKLIEHLYPPKEATFQVKYEEKQ